VTVLKVTLGYLYPDVMSTYGDRGNIETIVARCRWRGIEAEVRELRLGDPADGGLDLIVIGSGGEAQQRLIATDLARVKGPGIREAVVAGGAAALAVGGGYELFGRFCRPGTGADLPGVGLFDAWTIRSRAVLGGAYGTITEARADRHIGELAVRWAGRLLAGFENHSGATYLGPTAQPLGQVLCGHGNSGSGHEGALLGAAVGTHLRGPCLPRNPALADFLIGAALRRRQPGARLEPLPDELEQAARQAALRRAWQASGHRGSGLVAAAVGAAAVAGAMLGAPAARSGRRRAASAAVSHGSWFLNHGVTRHGRRP
jgi:CobQ-like glutamine amidotransferase family enzyme